MLGPAWWTIPRIIVLLLGVIVVSLAMLPARQEAAPVRGVAIESLSESPPAPSGSRPIVDLLSRVNKNGDLADVATGRLLADPSAEALALLRQLDPDQLRAIRRSIDWVLAEATGTTSPSTDVNEVGRTRVRMVRVDAEWRIEHVRWLPVEGKRELR